MLYVTPNRHSMLVEAGYTSFDGCDANRIPAAAKDAGITRIDTLVATHFTRITSAAFPKWQLSCRSGNSSITAGITRP